MATRVSLRGDLDRIVAARFALPAVNRLAEMVESAARRGAPDGKGWITYEDERVRPAHADADSQIIPANLRYQLRRQEYVRGSGRGRRPSVPGFYRLAPASTGYDLAREPRDESLPQDQKINCRCESVDLPGIVARSIHASQAVLSGSRVTAEVSTRFHRAAESEFGTAQDPGAHFMAGAVHAAAVRLRAGGRA